jgi:hypothetical protein
MKYLVAFFILAGSAFASDLGTSHDLILFGSQSIAAGQTNTVETDVFVTGIAKGAIVYASGSGVTTTTVSSVRSSTARAIATIAANNTVVNSNVTHNLYAETIRFVTVNHGAGEVSVSPAIIYEK